MLIYTLEFRSFLRKLNSSKKESAHFYMFFVNSQIKQILKHIWINSYKYLETSGTYCPSLMIFATYHGFLEIHICQHLIDGHISGQVTNFVSGIYSISIAVHMNAVVLFIYSQNHYQGSRPSIHVILHSLSLS